jgi:superfamily II DNA or RNA helicase
VAEYSEIIKRTHWFIKKAELKKPLHELKRFFTIHGRFVDTEPVEVFKETKSYFGVPLYYRNMGRFAGKVIDQTRKGKPIEMSFTSDLREKQKPVLDQFVQSIAQGKKGFLFTAPTGTGKTICMLDMLSRLKKTALVVVPRNAIVNQWIERIVEHTDIKREEIGLAQQNVCDYEGKKIVVGMIHSLIKDKYPMEFKDYFGVIVFDEVHVTGAPEFSKAVSLFPAEYRIGATATPERADKMDDVYKMHLAEASLRIGGGTDVTPTVFLRGYTAKKAHPYLHKIQEAVNRRGVLITELAKDTARNALIALYVKKFVKSGRRTLILSDRKDQLKVLRDLMTKRHGLVPKDVGIFVHETKEIERKRVLNRCKVILATYGVMSMAMDVPDLRALVFATPQSEVEQPLGRILRMCETVKDPVALDIIDMKYNDAVRWAKRRQEHYEKAKVKVIIVKS